MNSGTLFRVLFSFLSCGFIHGQDIGSFWHITDMHWDPTYSSSQAALSCSPNSGQQFGLFGDYKCDSPHLLLASAISAMREFASDVDFLIWTGDDTPHIWNDTILNKQVVFDIIHNQTDMLRNGFPDKIVYSAIGNHDWSPKSQLPPHPDPFYDDLADIWEPWLTPDANETFRKAAYYTRKDPTFPRIVVLNTNLHYDSNKFTANMPDPANQFQWFDDVMTKAASSGEKVIVIAHVPPGVFEKHRNKHWFYPYYNDMFSALLKKHAASIGGVHMGHHHTDSFRVLYDDNGAPVSCLFLAPSVTPWETTLPDVMGGKGNNPSIRLVKYDRLTGITLDIEQYYLNLPTANAAADDNWELEYKATSYYDVPDLSAASCHELAQRIQKDDAAFDKYYKANGVLYDPNEVWNEETRTIHYCAITNVNYDDYEYCTSPEVSTTTQTNAAVGVIAVSLFITALYSP